MNYTPPIRMCDIANGEGVRVSLFVSGCENRCIGCFNSALWDYGYGERFTEREEDLILEACKRREIAGLSILGGDPMMPRNQEGIVSLLRRFRKTCEGKTVWIYTGLTFEELKSEARWRTGVTDEILGMTDVLVDGRFEIDKKDVSLPFRGSSNQRILVLDGGKVVSTR